MKSTVHNGRTMRTTLNAATTVTMAAGLVMSAMAAIGVADETTQGIALPEVPYPKSDAIKGIHWVDMFPSKQFPTPFFVQFGKDYQGAMDDYVYLVSNDGGWNNWDSMKMARVPRRTIGDLNAKDYNPNLPSKWFAEEEKRLWIVQGGNYRTGGGYCFITRQMEFVLP